MPAPWTTWLVKDLALLFRVDCETMRIIGAETAQVKLEFMKAHKVEPVVVDGAALEVVDKFCYLGYSTGGADESVIARTRSGSYLT